ncbi:MAG: hypothetical protein WCS95_08605 [Lentisphaeria bacterium]|nr:hypothetical protein [Lentisphaeria bacterium]
MIYLGRTHKEKQAIIKEACVSASHVVIFHGSKTPEVYEASCPIEYRAWDDIIMYKYFYRLLQEITSDSVIILDEIMRTQDRNCLTYNCLLHYIRKAERCLVFQYFPIIDDVENFCILADMVSCGRTRGTNYAALRGIVADVVRRDYQIIEQPVGITDADRKTYDKKKAAIFSRPIKDPEALPRQVALVAGDIKAKSCSPESAYVARNARFKRPNILTYKNAPRDAIILDPPVSAIVMHDHLAGGADTPAILYMSTGLPVDKHYIEFYRGIAESMRRIYDDQEK